MYDNAPLGVLGGPVIKSILSLNPRNADYRWIADDSYISTNLSFQIYSARLNASFFVTITTPTELWVPLLCIQRTTIHI